MRRSARRDLQVSLFIVRLSPKDENIIQML